MYHLRNIAMCDYQIDRHTHTQTDAGQSDPYVPLCFAGDTIKSQLPRCQKSVFRYQQVCHLWTWWAIEFIKMCWNNVHRCTCMSKYFASTFCCDFLESRNENILRMFLHYFINASLHHPFQHNLHISMRFEIRIPGIIKLCTHSIALLSSTQTYIHSTPFTRLK